MSLHLLIFVYQFQTKLRNELRAKSGILRGREFLMKDMYSYTTDPAAHEDFYNQAIQSYLKVFERVGLGNDTFLTFASGGAFTQFSHEFQTLLPGGEDTIYLSREKNVAVNKEVMDDKVLDQLGLKKNDLEEVQASETGNIFNFGSIKSEQMKLYYKDEQGNSVPVILGSYGIGITRLMGVIVEKFHDEKGIIWPKSVSPFDLHLINIAKDQKDSDKIYNALQEQGFSVLYDQRDTRAGEKFADADLIGIPTRILVSDKTLESDSVEIKDRNSERTSIVKVKDLTKSLK